MRTVFLAAGAMALFFLSFPALAGELPGELDALEEHLDDEERLVEAARAFDLEQMERFEETLEAARDLQAEGETDAAQEKLAQALERRDLVRRAYEEVLAHHPENARAMMYLGDLLYDFYPEAEHEGVELWKEAVDIDPELADAHNSLGIHLCHVGEYEDGIHHIDKALELEPDNPDFLFNVTQLYMVHFPQVEEIKGWDRERVYETAMDMSRRATELRPEDYTLLKDYAQGYFSAENFGVEPDWSEAAKAWERAREHAPQEDVVFYTWLNEARAWERDGSPEEALRCAEEALELQPDSHAAQNLKERVRQDAEDGEG